MGIKWYLVNDGKDAINVALICGLEALGNMVKIYTMGGHSVLAADKDIATVIAEIATITGAKNA